MINCNEACRSFNLFSQGVNKLYNTGARMLDNSYHMESK